jgi:hypothetical protein
MHVATNSIQCCWQKQPDGTSKVMPLQCDFCGVPLTLQHLAHCVGPDSVSFRATLRLALLRALDYDASVTPWLQAHQHLPLPALLLRLFPPPPDTPNDLHITRVMCGVFSTRQANAAIKQLGLEVLRANDTRRFIQQLRLCCLDAVHQHFNALKIALL